MSDGVKLTGQVLKNPQTRYWGPLFQLARAPDISLYIGRYCRAFLDEVSCEVCRSSMILGEYSLSFTVFLQSEFLVRSTSQQSVHLRTTTAGI